MSRAMIRAKLLTACLACLVATLAPAAANADSHCPDGHVEDTDLPLPCSMPLADYEELLYTWANDRGYSRLGWVTDRHVRDTGPFVLGANYGTHPAVRIHYSPSVVRWLEQGRPSDRPPPPGAAIVKEMFAPPAARYEERRPAGCEDGCPEFDAMLQSEVDGWTIMIRDDSTRDGWFWGAPTFVDRAGKTAAEVDRAIAGSVDTTDYPFNFHYSNHGQASCLRCHAVAESEFTFSSTKNISGDELRFRVDNSWRDLPAAQRPASEAELFVDVFHGASTPAALVPDRGNLVADPLAAPNAEFVEHFQLGRGVTPPAPDTVASFPGQWADHVTAGPDGAEQFITSDNCLGCHGGLGGPPDGISMFLRTGAAYGDGFNISPFGEWRWSPMGLAGRDPAFFSQLATEQAILDEDFQQHPERFGGDRQVLERAKSAVVNTCLSCHGAMGQRQLLIDAVDDPGLDPDFKRRYVDVYTALTRAQESQPDYRYRKYGNLAREGVSCALCHHIDEARPTPGKRWTELENFLMTSTSGQFPYTPPDELSGPYADVAELPMENALGITPRLAPYISDSKMCGTCHTINLPNVDSKQFEFPALDESAKLQATRLEEEYGVDYASFLTRFPHSIEQATFLEWQNSSFAEEEGFLSCQDCHMPNDFHAGGLEIDQLSSRIASIQDADYPTAEHSLPPAEIEVPFRDTYSRHELVGLNVFLLEMFDQFEPVLGIAEADYMTSASTGNRLAIENMVDQAANETVGLEVAIVAAGDRRLTADVSVTNLVGHRFPSGVGFRRSWIELLVLDGRRAGEVIWASGRTNSVGLIVDGLSDTPLPTEFFAGNHGQPHYHGIPGPDGEQPAAPPITAQDQVQIYEEIVADGDGQVTFSFIHRDKNLKDNRLLPRGWKASAEFASEILRQFMESTDPKGVSGDPDYDSVPGFAGRDSVRYEIALPPGTDPVDLSLRATIYYQAFQPFWLKRKFEISGDSPDTQRLYFLASHLDTGGTVIEDWKLPLVSVTEPVR